MFRIKEKNLLITPFLFFFFRDVNRFYKVKIQTILSPLVTQFLYLVIFGVGLGRVVKISDQFSYLQFVIPGLVALSLLNQSFQNGSSSIFSMKITGEIIDVKTTPLGPNQIILAVACSGLLRGFIVSFLTLIIGEIFHFIFEGSFLPIHHFFWLIAFLFLGGLVFSIVGFSVGVWSKSFDHIGAISAFIILPLIYLGGVWFDLDTLSSFWQSVSVFNPILYFINGIRYSFLSSSDIPVLKSFVMVSFSLVISYCIAYFMTFKGSFQRSF
ncbi:MAG: ABC transporter permease [Bdellovibrionales bacterium]|nr:ABC transporter permease [Bdellovibrionales bacterium]